MSAVVDEAAVRRGIAWLDDQDPTWRERVDPDRLDMGIGVWWRDSNNLHVGCVCAQLDLGGDYEGDYEHFLTVSGVPVAQAERAAWAVAHGFEVDDPQYLTAYDTLTQAWLRLAFGREVDADA